MKTVGILRSFTLAFFTLVAAVLFLMRASPASAANCMQDLYGSKKLNCTANDVTVSFADNIRNLDGSKLTTCNPGAMFSFVADFHVVTTATSRQNIGIYFQTAGGSTALKGTCSDNIISPVHTAVNPDDTIKLGSPTYNEVDPSPDSCGDTTSAYPEVVTIEVDNVLCQPAPGTNKLILPTCTSWQQNSGILCESDPPNYAFVPEAKPGTTSKCSCNNGFTIDIAVQSPSVSVTKSVDKTTFADPGGTATYTVSVANDSNFGSVTLNQVCDSAYGTIATTAGQPACPAGITGLDGTATATSCTLPTSIAKGSAFDCKFTANMTEAHTPVTDIATANGVGADGTTPFSKASNSVTVTVNEAASTSTTTKSLNSTTAGCATIRYGVDIHNTGTADEVLSLTALSDSQYGSITALGKGAGGTLLGTTCGVAGAAGLGTLSGSAGAGALPASIAVDGHYTCLFDAQFCGALGTIDLGGGNSCTGIQLTDVVTPTLKDDEGGTSVTNSGGSLTVSECFTPSAK